MSQTLNTAVLIGLGLIFGLTLLSLLYHIVKWILARINHVAIKSFSFKGQIWFWVIHLFLLGGAGGIGHQLLKNVNQQHVATTTLKRKENAAQDKVKQLQLRRAQLINENAKIKKLADLDDQLTKAEIKLSVIRWSMAHQQAR